MQSFVLHLFSYWVILFASCNGISTTTVQPAIEEVYTASSLQMRHGGCEVMYFTETGTAEGSCYHSGSKKSYIIVNGMDVTKEVTTRTFGNGIDFAIPLNRKTVMGDYRCHNDELDIYPLYRIGYILCDPSEIVPAKVCPKGQFCVINGLSTSCRERLDCEVYNPSMYNFETGECLSGQLAKPINDSCRVYNIAQEAPNDYYIEDHPRRFYPCFRDPRVMHNGRVVKYQSTIPVSSSHELERHKWNRVGNLSISGIYCKMDEKNYNMTFNQSDFSAAWDGNLPSKVSVCCKTLKEYHGDSIGSTIFYIIFYRKNRTRFNIVQKWIAIDITNTTNQELLLDPTAPFKCTVSTDVGLFIEAFSMKGNSTGQAKLGKDSVEMKYIGDSTYTCFAKVYYYEYFGGTRFKPLYTEKRDFTIYHSAVSTTWTTGASTGNINTGSSAPAVLVGICVGVAMVAAVLLVIVLLGIGAYRKKAKQSKKDQDVVPFHQRPVKAPESDRFKSMTADASAALVSASHKQTSGVSGIGHLVYKRKPKPRMSTGSVGTGSGHFRRSRYGIPERSMFTRRGTGTVESKAKSGRRAGSLATGSSHVRRSSQGIGAGKPRATRRGTETDESKDESTSAI